MARPPSQGAPVERLIAAEKWPEARRLLRALLKDRPEDHWLLSRLALTYYEQREYEKALELELQAVRVAPRCPLALWGLAGSQQMLGNHREAATLFQRLIRRGAARLASGPCGEGVRWARGLVADSWFRLGMVRQAQGQPRRAKIAYGRHLALRSGGASIYTVAEVRARLRAL